LTFFQGDFVFFGSAIPLILTSFVLSMAVNAMVTGLVVFKILKVFLQVKAVTTSVERTLGTTGGTKLRHVIFIVIESGMALFAVQLARMTLGLQTDPELKKAVTIIVGIYEMFNVIICLFQHFLFYL
jgi:hypothetical protein